MRAGVVAIALAVAGCLERAAVNCADGTVCPLDRVCIPGGCALAEQLSSCEGLADGSSCVFSGIAGECLGGVCLGSQCGNGAIDDGEICDDGNVASGDGCRGDCAKEELCGDSVVDSNEGCDDGNTNPADGCNDQCQPTQWVPSTLIGGMANATVVGLKQPLGVAVDTLGNLYIADTENHRIERVDTNGVLTTIAGTGIQGFGGDNGPATSALLASPAGVAVDGLGNVYISDTYNNRVRRVDPSGTITTIAGLGDPGPLGDNGPASGARLAFPMSLVVDGLGNLLVADSVNHRIRKIDTNGMITTIAGTVQGFSGDGGLATAATLNTPDGVAFDTSGRVLIADSSNHRIRRIETNGTITTIAGASSGCGAGCAGGSTGDGGQATSALLNHPSSISVRADGIYIADRYNSRVRRIDGAGVITTFAGGATTGFGGDGSAATSASLDDSAGVVCDALGNLFIADGRNNRIRKVDSAGTISTSAGSGTSGYSGDGLRATSAVVQSPIGVAVDGAGNIYIAEEANHRIRRVSPDGLVTTVAGTGQPGYRASDDGGRAVNAWLSSPGDVDIDNNGNLIIADTNNNRIRKVDPTGIITTIAGTGVYGYDGDNAQATTKAVSTPTGVTHDPAGNLYISEAQTARVRRVDPTGVITTFAGTGVSGTSPDGGAATSSKLTFPWGLAFRGGELYIADFLAWKVRRVDATGKMFTVAGTGTQATSGDGGAATSASLSGPRDIAFDTTGTMYIADQVANRIRRVSSGTITTLVGTGTDFNSGDGGGVTGAQLADPMSIATDAAGNVYIASRLGNRVRRLAGGILTTVAGLVDPPGIGPIAMATLADPQQLVVAGPFMIAAGGNSGTVQLVRATTVEIGAGRYAQLGATGQLARYRGDQFGTVHGVAYDASTSTLYFTEPSANRIHAVSVVNPDDVSTWTIAPLANAAGTAGFANGAAATARFRAPTGLYLDVATHQLFVADTGNHVIRAIDLSGGVTAATVSTLVGVPATLGFFGDGGAATSALLYSPNAITRCPNGDLFIADTGNQRVRRIEASTMIVSTVLGDGIAASSGEGAPSSAFPVHAPLGITCDSIGNVLVTSTTTVRMLAANDDGIIDGLGDVQTIYGKAPRTMFPVSVTSCLTGIESVDPATVRIVDACTGLLVELRQEKK